MSDINRRLSSEQLVAVTAYLTGQAGRLKQQPVTAVQLAQMVEAALRFPCTPAMAKRIAAQIGIATTVRRPADTAVRAMNAARKVRTDVLRALCRAVTQMATSQQVEPIPEPDFSLLYDFGVGRDGE